MGAGERHGVLTAAESRLSRVASIALLIAAVYSGVVVVAGFLVPVYQTAAGSSSGQVRSGSATLVAENGLAVALILGIPLLVTVAVGSALWHRSRHGALPLAWTLIGLLAVFNLLAVMSIGVFVLPVTVALVVACSTRHSARQRQGAHGYPSADG